MSGSSAGVRMAADRTVDARERLIVALDFTSINEANEMAAILDGVASFFKIGLQLQLVPGMEKLMRWLIKGNKNVFIDYKYYDIGETVKEAAARAAELGVRFITVHGNGEILEAAVKGRGTHDLKILCITVLTNLDAFDLRDLFGTDVPVEDLVRHRTIKALEYGCDGVIAAPRDVPLIRQLAGPERLLVVTPGIRPDGASLDDHKRAGTPTEAIAAGADYLVVGRPITRSADPASAARRIIDEMQAAFDSRRGVER